MLASRGKSLGPCRSAQPLMQRVLGTERADQMLAGGEQTVIL